MLVDETRFAKLVGPHCPGESCETPVIWCHANLRDGRLLVDAEPHREGTIRLTDTGSENPLATRLTVAASFGRQGTLHRVHTVYCEEAKRATARRKRR